VRLLRHESVQSSVEDFYTEEKMKKIFDAISDFVFVLDRDSRFVRVNKATCDLLKKEPEELIGKRCFEVLHGTDKPWPNCPCKKMLVTKEVATEEIIDPNLGIALLVTVSPLFDDKGEHIGCVHVAKDITERKKTEEALRESEEKFRNIFESANDGLIYLDRSGRILDVNGKAVQVFGGSKKELLGKHFTRVGIFSLREIPTLMTKFAKILAGKQAALNVCIKNKKGQEISLECSSSLMKIGDKFAGILVIARDITERKKAEEALKESEERLRQLIEYAPDAIYINNLKGNFIHGNKQAEKLTGYKRDELIGKNMLKIGLLPKRYLPKAMKALTKNVLGQKTGPDEFELMRKDGTRVTVEISTFPVKRGGKIEVIGIARDITERKQMEKKLEEYSEHLEELVEKRTNQLKKTQEQLLKSERLAAIGEVAAMVGHDLRSPLTGIAGATYYLKTKFGPKMDKKTKEMLELIEKDIEHSNNIISSLLDYSREIRLELAETTPKSIIKDALTLVKAPKNIRILDLTENEPKIKIDLQKMKRVFVNIIKNTVDAMPEGGKLTITSKESNGNLEIAFTDTGTGIPKDIVEKIWTPLFTTKAKGMGLGLSICKRIVEAHRGSISVESTVGKDTTFTVTFPIKPKIEGGEKIWVNVPESLLLTTTKA